MSVKWPKCDPKTVAPSPEGRPDTYNHMPTRFITQEEAIYREWTHFYIGETCRFGHMAPRYATNKHQCVDCARHKEGRLLIGAKGEAKFTQPTQAQLRAQKSRPTNVTLEPVEPDNLEKRFIIAYAQTRSFAKAAEECGRHESEFLGRLSFSKVFRDAVHLLESENGLARTPLLTDEFEWTDDKRKVMARVYVDTGDLIRAMKAIGVTNYHYLTEMEENPDFVQLMGKAEAMAKGYAERIFIGMGLDGSERAMAKVVAVQNPEYGDRMKLDMNVTNQSEDQINVQLFQLLKQCGLSLPTSSPTIDAEFVVALPNPEVEDIGTAEDESEDPAEESNNDLL
jgi:hypothetical protein